MRNDSIVYEKSFKFAKRIIKLYKFLVYEKKERVISHQIMKSGTSIGANISEATYAQSRKDFINKMSVALKEANETKYWIALLEEEYISKKEADSLLSDVMEILKMLVSIVKNLIENELLLILNY